MPLGTRARKHRGSALPTPPTIRHAALALGIGLLGAVLSLGEVAHRAEESWGLLALFGLRGPQPPPEGVEIVAVDEASLARFRELPADPARWPEPLASCQRRAGGLEALPSLQGIDRLPRALHACLVETLAGLGAAVIVFDIAFGHDPGRAAGTDTLARAIAAHGRVVLLTRARRLWRDDPAGEARPLHAVVWRLACRCDGEGRCHHVRRVPERAAKPLAPSGDAPLSPSQPSGPAE